MIQNLSNEDLDKLTKFGGMTTKFAIFVGILVCYNYFAFQINFFPSGLGIGDSLWFLFVSISFGLFYSLWILSGFSLITHLNMQSKIN